jgi:hypothetical protein
LRRRCIFPILVNGDLGQFRANYCLITTLGIETKRARHTAQLIAPDVDKGLARRFVLLQALSRKEREIITRTIDALIAAKSRGRAA